MNSYQYYLTIPQYRTIHTFEQLMAFAVLTVNDDWHFNRKGGKNVNIIYFFFTKLLNDGCDILVII